LRDVGSAIDGQQAWGKEEERENRPAKGSNRGRKVAEKFGMCTCGRSEQQGAMNSGQALRRQAS
jgi:hypothetical protein